VIITFEEGALGKDTKNKKETMESSPGTME